MLKVLDVFSGFAGFTVGLESTGGFETIAFCEIEAYPRKVLAQNWPLVPIAGDIRKLSYNKKTLQLFYKTKVIYVGPIDVICGGFPCQDISAAGNQAGIEKNTRSGLWSELPRLLGEIQPELAIFENVTALLSGDCGGWIQRVLWDISQKFYDAECHCIPASEFGAHHHRDRAWIVAYPQSQRVQGFGTSGQQEPHSYEEPLLSVRDCEGLGQSLWEAEPNVVRVVDGIPHRSHRVKGLGNAVVPIIPKLIGQTYLKRKNVPHETN